MATSLLSEILVQFRERVIAWRAAVAALDQGVLTTVLRRKVRAALVLLVVVGMVLASASLLTHRSQAAAPAVPCTAPADDEDLREELTLQQKRVWRALQKQDVKAFKELVPADFAGINRNGLRYGRADGLQFMAHYKIATFNLSESKVQEVNRDAAVLTYRVQYQIASNAGNEIVELSVINVAVFARRDGKWYCVFGQETPVRM
jgi:hypothetical protein